jgi:APA family basic amino acid/polyamine antiporter
MPFGIIGSLVVCTVIYMLVAAIMTLLVPYQQLNVPDPVAVVVDNFGATWGWLAKIIKIGAIIGLTSVVLVLMYAQTRIFYTMARDGLLPRIFARVHPRFQTPYINTMLVGLITATAAGFFDINVLGDMTSVGTLAAFAIVALSVIYLRRAAPDLPRGFKVPLYPVLPILGVLSCLYLITTVPWDVLRFFMWYMIGGVILYFVYGMRNSELGKGHPVTADGEMPYYKEDNPDQGTVTRD